MKYFKSISGELLQEIIHVCDNCGEKCSVSTICCSDKCKKQIMKNIYDECNDVSADYNESKNKEGE